MCPKSISSTYRIYLAAFFVCAVCLSGVSQSPQVEGIWDKTAALDLGNPVGYRLAWEHHFDVNAETLEPGAAEDDGTLWVMAYSTGNPSEFLVRIGPSGDLLDTIHPRIPLRPIEWVSDFAPAVSGHKVGLLATLASVGKDQTFEGAFFSPILPTGQGEPVRISRVGPQFPTLVAAGAGQFIAAGDQDPLTLIKVEASGKVLWRRNFSRRLFLPALSVGPSGSIFVLSQRSNDTVLQMLDAEGHLVRSKPLVYKQGDIVVESDGGCTVLASTKVGGVNNTVYLVNFDRTLRQTGRVKTPLIGWGGREYQLMLTPHGHVVLGPGPKPGSPYGYSRVIAEFDHSGRELWRYELPGTYETMLVPFRDGFYIVRKVFPGEGTTVQKYLY